MEKGTVLKAGATYFLLVFAIGFALGTIRTLWAAPRWGARTAELMETPLMIGASVLIARRIVRRLSVPGGPPRLGMGLIALSLLVAAEVGLVLLLQRVSLADYVASRDPVSGTVYLLAMALFAAAPSLVCRTRR